MKFTMLMIIAIQNAGDQDRHDQREVPHHVGERQADARHADVEVDGHADGEQLADELDDGLELVQVVEEADGDDDRGAADDAPHGPVHLDEQHHRDHPAEVHAEAAEQRRGQLVHATVVGGRVDGAGALGEAAHQRRQHVDDERGDEEAQDRRAQRAGEAQRPADGSSSLMQDDAGLREHLAATARRDSPRGSGSRAPRS